LAKLIKIHDIGACIHATCHTLGKIHPHDVVSESADVKIKFDALLNDYDKLGKHIDSFRIARNRYLEFF
jgi:hypothetical protein